MKNECVTVIGAGLAGCEAAYQIAKRGISVLLIEAKPGQRSAAHHSDDFAELVCSNSLKSQDPYTAHGLLKQELGCLDSLVLRCAEVCKIPAGGALAVDRERFAKTVTSEIFNIPNITVRNETAETFSETKPTVIATGPLTLGALADKIRTALCGNLAFYDAAAPIVTFDSIDKNYAFIANRYGKGEGDGDYINCPLSRDEYYAFVDGLVSAERSVLKDFESGEIFEGCMPIEIMAERGRDTLRFGPLKPVGITDPSTGKRPFAVVQLRKETMAGEAYNLVGFQTNLRFSDQQRVFGLIPALKHAEFLRYGVMHRNTYLDAPKVLDRSFRVKNFPNLYVAGQLSGVEGYIESIASGLFAGIAVSCSCKGIQLAHLPETTVLGALCRYLTTPNPNFQPMNANFGLLPNLSMRDKLERKQVYRERSLEALNQFISQNHFVF